MENVKNSKINLTKKHLSVDIKESISTDLQKKKKKLYIPKKRKPGMLNEKNKNSYEMEDLYKP